MNATTHSKDSKDSKVMAACAVVLLTLAATAANAGMPTEDKARMAQTAAEQAKNPPPRMPSAAAQNAPTRGRIDLVDAKKGTVMIGGRVLPLDANLRVQGSMAKGESGVSALKPGMLVRYTLDPNAKALVRPVVAIHIEKA